MAYLRQLENKYDLEDELSAVESRHSDGVGRGEIVFPECESRTLFIVILTE